jgi:hypothetical protein
MCENVRDYFQREYEAFLKSYEIQFTHFMGVFYFWITIVTFPATAGLIAKEHALSEDNFILLLRLLAGLAFFVAAKMYDIRCSQLKYIKFKNDAQQQLYNLIPENDRPKDYTPTGRNFKPRKAALLDFGIMMAIIMSLVEAAYIGYAEFLKTTNMIQAIEYSFVIWIFGIIVYILFVLIKLRPKKLS